MPRKRFFVKLGVWGAQREDAEAEIAIPLPSAWVTREQSSFTRERRVDSREERVDEGEERVLEDMAREAPFPGEEDAVEEGVEDGVVGGK